MSFTVTLVWFWWCSLVVASPAIGAGGGVFAASLTRALVPPKRYGQPEIIVNRAPTATVTPQRDTAAGPSGYSYDPPSGSYLPPPESVPFADEPPAPSVSGGYLPPVVQDEPVFVPPAAVLPEYLPPARDEPVFVVTTPAVPAATGQGYNYNPPTASFSPPLADEGIDEVEVTETGEGYRYDPPTNIYLPPAGGGVGRSLLRDGEPAEGSRPVSPIRLQLNELACLRNSGGFFRAALTLQGPLESVPLVDVDDSDAAAGCEVRLDQTRLLLDIAWPDFGRCGVVPCGGAGATRELCLRVRFPAIAGMRTAVDPVLTLQCRIQQRVVARTHSVRLGVANDPPAGRGIGTSFGTALAVGGSQRPFRSQLGVFRRQAGGAFTRPLPPGGAVMLGEELMLRTQVSAGDGWNFTRLSEVVLQRLSPAGTVLNSASLVTASGCLNPLMRAISPAAPVFEAPLGYRLGFRAAMFQGMRSGDEMVLRVRIVGCVDRRECLVENCVTARTKRETALEGAEGASSPPAPPANETAGPPPLLTETASIAFRIMLPEDVASSGSHGAELADRGGGPRTPQSLLWVTVGTTATVLLAIGGLALLLLVLRHQRRPTYDGYRSD
ncbi:uncharacterized protein LOC131215119 [Anopheles bellator]|uniref:uncharacterized protein LOC131215119 n=1 Tax=Anopheles bellator TaxID=139047 RepID=UPI0026477DAB|nr:uncharacterized protein LOC131215119 [Anopheles bellator]